MPKDPRIKKVLVIGSGPIIIGQAAEFDYSGTQACRALKAEGIETVLLNSNPATIMTDPDVADHVYIEPMTLEVVERILDIEKPDSVLPNLGGQMGLNLSMELARSGYLDRTGIPTFGICLGHQLTALAAGAKTCKLKYGHRGANQPVTSPAKQRTFITSQNHGYAVMADTLPESVGQMSYFNANDGTCEGVDYLKWNCFTVQFHPEANGGPKDTEFLFDQFVSRMLAAKGVINNA